MRAGELAAPFFSFGPDTPVALAAHPSAPWALSGSIVVDEAVRPDTVMPGTLPGAVTLDRMVSP
jgi:hypothetical protein